MGKAIEQSDESFEVVLEVVWQEFGLGFPEGFSSGDPEVFFRLHCVVWWTATTWRKSW